MKDIDYERLIFPVIKSETQKTLERNGCRFKLEQELLSNHEIDPKKPCYCGRPLRTSHIANKI